MCCHTAFLSVFHHISWNPDSFPSRHATIHHPNAENVLVCKNEYRHYRQIARNENSNFLICPLSSVTLFTGKRQKNRRAPLGILEPGAPVLCSHESYLNQNSCLLANSFCLQKKVATCFGFYAKAESRVSSWIHIKDTMRRHMLRFTAQSRPYSPILTLFYR